MKFKLLILITTFMSLQLHAINCESVQTQVEITECAFIDYQNADKKLNENYQKLRKLKKSDKLYLKNLKIAQKAWIKFRDAEVKTVFSCKSGNMTLCWGSMYSISYHGEMMQITIERTKRLQLYIDKFNE